MIVFSVDPSINSSGYAIFKDGEFVFSGRIRNNSGEDVEKRKSKIQTVIEFFLTKFDKDEERILIVEDQFVGRSIKSSKTIIEVKELCLTCARHFGFSVLPIHPKTWQTALFPGNARRKREELKKMAKILASKITGIMEERLTEDESDAICIGHWFLTKYQNT